MAIVPGRRQPTAAWTGPIVTRAVMDALRKLDPRVMVKNPIIFIVEIGAVLTTVLFARDLVEGEPWRLVSFELQIALWLWFTVLFANFAEAVAEGRGKAQADTLRKTRSQAVAWRETVGGTLEEVPAGVLRRGDIVAVEAGQLIPGDGDVVEGLRLSTRLPSLASPRLSSKNLAQIFEAR